MANKSAILGTTLSSVLQMVHLYSMADILSAIFGTTLPLVLQMVHYTGWLQFLAQLFSGAPNGPKYSLSWESAILAPLWHWCFKWSNIQPELGLCNFWHHFGIGAPNGLIYRLLKRSSYTSNFGTFRHFFGNFGILALLCGVPNHPLWSTVLEKQFF